MIPKRFIKIIANTFLLFCFLIGGFGILASVSAQESNSNLRIFYQGVLTDNLGRFVEDGRYNLRFVIYDAEIGGNIVWQEEYAFYEAITVKDGQFKILLGRIRCIYIR